MPFRFGDYEVYSSKPYPIPNDVNLGNVMLK